MRTVIYGKVIENTYEVDSKQKEIRNKNGEVKLVYTDKPTLTKIENVDHWVELYSYDGTPMYNSKSILDFNSFYGTYHTVNISEDEELKIEKEIFRADLLEMQLRTNKVVGTIETNKEEAESNYNSHVEAFNKMMIESNEQLKAYCDLHKLWLDATDCIELFKLVFPNKEYEIVDGVMRVKENSTLYMSTEDGIKCSITGGYLPINGSIISGTINGITESRR